MRGYGGAFQFADAPNWIYIVISGQGKSCKKSCTERFCFWIMNETMIPIRIFSNIYLLPIFLLFLGKANEPAYADISEKLSNSVGYTVVATESIDDFKGCEYGKIIQFESGLHVTCKDYGYQYAYSATAVILYRLIVHGKARLASCKMVVENEMYDVQCRQYVRKNVALLRSISKWESDKMRSYIDNRIQLFLGACS